MTEQTKTGLEGLQAIDERIVHAREQIEKFEPMLDEVEEPAVASERTRPRAKGLRFMSGFLPGGPSARLHPRPVPVPRGPHQERPGAHGDGRDAPPPRSMRPAAGPGVPSPDSPAAPRSSACPVMTARSDWIVLAASGTRLVTN